MAAVEWQKDLDVVLTVSLWGRRKTVRSTYATRGHCRGLLPSPRARPRGRAFAGNLRGNRKRTAAVGWLAELSQGLHFRRSWS